MQRRRFLLLLVASALSACATPAVRNAKTLPTAQSKPAAIDDYFWLIMAAEQTSSGLTQNILRTARKMTLEERFIIRGGCWDYLDAVWTRAGVGRAARKTVFKSSKTGAYARAADLRAGDWLYHINHSYHNTEHSGLFIGWVDAERHLGLTLSYAGGHRRETGRYRVYDLSSVYQIIRAP